VVYPVHTFKGTFSREGCGVSSAYI
jgi:hypothetical protein